MKNKISRIVKLIYKISLILYTAFMILMVIMKEPSYIPEQDRFIGKIQTIGVVILTVPLLFFIGSMFGCFKKINVMKDIKLKVKLVMTAVSILISLFLSGVMFTITSNNYSEEYVKIIKQNALEVKNKKLVTEKVEKDKLANIEQEKIKQEELTKQEEEKKKQEELAKQEEQKIKQEDLVKVKEKSENEQELTINNNSENKMSKSPRLLGENKETVMKLLKNYKINKAYQQNVDPNAIKFEDNNLLIIVAFDGNGLAEGVAYLSTDGDFLTGKGSYVDLNYDKLVELATGGEIFKIENNPGTEYPTEIYIGNVHD